MNHPTNVTSVLNRLLTTLYRSLPIYVQGAHPWVPPDRRPALELLKRIAGDQQMYAQRVADAILHEGGRMELGQFPLEFAAFHDLGIDFLVKKAAESQRRQVEIVEECASALNGVPRLRSLAEEILGNARGHLETLEETMNDE